MTVLRVRRELVPLVLAALAAGALAACGGSGDDGVGAGAGAPASGGGRRARHPVGWGHSGRRPECSRALADGRHDLRDERVGVPERRAAGRQRRRPAGGGAERPFRRYGDRSGDAGLLP